MLNPYFSIIIPTYNRANMLSKAIESVIDQSFSDWELIIIDDGSTDGTKQVVENFKQDRIKYIYQTNQERSAARNNGISNAGGKYICFLDSDDYYLPQRLELLYGEIFKQKEPLSMYFTGINFEKNHQLQRKAERSRTEYQNVFDFIVWSQIGVPQACISREILQKHYFNPLFTIAEDMELWFRIANEYPIIYLPGQFTVTATEHDERSVNVMKNNVFLEVYKVYRYVLKKYNYPISKKTKRYICTDAYFGIARYYIYKKNRIMAFYSLLKSLIYDLRNPQFKYRLNILLNIIINLNKAEKLLIYH